jgi:hypothetical protein
VAKPKLNLVVLDPGSGKARPGASVSIFQANTTTLAALYADDDVTVVTNPVIANGLGQVSVRVATGLYDVSMQFDGNPASVVEDVAAMQPTDAGGGMTQSGDLIVGGPGGAPTVVHVGAEGQVLLVSGGFPTWGTPTTSGVLPINQPGDLVVGAITTGTPVRLPRGNAADVLTTGAAGSLIWSPPGGGGSGAPAGPGTGHGFLFLDGSVLRFWPSLGNTLWVNGQLQVIPAAGITMSPSGLVANTTYFIYAFMAGSVMTLEASQTSYTFTGGGFFKTGDATRTLVGMARTIAGAGGVAAWTYTPKQRFVVSLYSPIPRVSQTALTAGVNITSVNPVEVSPDLRIEYLSWGPFEVLCNVSGLLYPTNTAPGTVIFARLDGDGGPIAGHVMSEAASSLSQTWTNIAVTALVPPGAVGYHWVSLFAWVSPAGATATFAGDSGLIYTTRLIVTVTG